MCYEMVATMEIDIRLLCTILIDIEENLKYLIESIMQKYWKTLLLDRVSKPKVLEKFVSG